MPVIHSIKTVAAPALPSALAIARATLQVLIPLNLIIGALILALLIASLLDAQTVFNALGAWPSSGDHPMTGGMRAIMLVGIAAVACTHRILDPLREIVDTVRDGDPFAGANARRLQGIAWAVLGLELLRATNAIIAGTISTPATPIDIGWGLNFTRWLTVLLLFVLARVFAHGTHLRDDLEGTV